MIGIGGSVMKSMSHQVSVGNTCLGLGLRVVGLFLILSTCAVASIEFVDMTGPAGLSYVGQSYGASWGDFNSDGWPDLWTSNHWVQPQTLYINNGDGTFKDGSSLLDRFTQQRVIDQHAGAWIDFDNDGDQDLIALTGGGCGGKCGEGPKNIFFVNSDGKLRDEASDRGVDYSLCRSRTPLALDWNRDGWLDFLIMCPNRVDGQKAPSAVFTQQDLHFTKALFPNPLPEGVGRFAQISLSNPTYPGASLVFLHANRYPFRIYKYDEAVFQDVTSSYGFPTTPRKTYTVEDVAIADFDGDLYGDFYLATRPAGGKAPDRVILQKEGGFIDRVGLAAGLDPDTKERSVVSADFDNDMDLDVYVVCANSTSNLPNILYENIGNGMFRNIKGAGGAEGTKEGAGDTASVVDYDRDGFMDIFVTNGLRKTNGPNLLFRNKGNKNNWIEIDLQGRVSNADGIGSRVLITAGGVTQLREQNGGIHNRTQNHQRLHVGLGKNTIISKIEVEWPSGTVQKLTEVGVNKAIRIREPAGSGVQQVDTPVISPQSGRVRRSDPISISTATPHATLYYTKSGKTPTSASIRYTAPFTLSSDATVKAIAVKGGFLDSKVAIARFTVTDGGGGGQQPFGGVSATIPGVIEAENYDLGGESIAYHDTSIGNKGSMYRSDDVDIWKNKTEGYYTGSNVSGEWLEYTVNVTTAGEYAIDFRVATPKDGRRLHLEAGGINVSGRVVLPNTGGWRAWQTITSNARLNAGEQVLRAVVERGGFNFSWMSIHQ